MELTQLGLRLGDCAERRGAVEHCEPIPVGISVADIMSDEDHAETPAAHLGTWRTNFGTIEVWATPSAKVGSSRISTLPPK